MAKSGCTAVERPPLVLLLPVGCVDDGLLVPIGWLPDVGMRCSVWVRIRNRAALSPPGGASSGVGTASWRAVEAATESRGGMGGVAEARGTLACAGATLLWLFGRGGSLGW